MNYISNGTLPIYITLYILFEVKLISICECLNPMTMQVCILSSFIIIIIFILFIFFSVIIGVGTQFVAQAQKSWGMSLIISIQ